MLLGYPIVTGEENNALIWNYGNDNVSPKNLVFGLGIAIEGERMRLTGTGLLGIGTADPKYTLDMFTGSAGVHPCQRDGLRIKKTDGFTSCDSGLFLGYSNLNETNKVSLWNFTANPNNTNQYIRFGFGADDSDGTFSYGESMRILPPGQGIGVGIQNPQAMVHIRNNTGGGVLSGVMTTSPSLPANSLGFYTGLRFISGGNANDGFTWNYQNAATIFGTNDLERMKIAANGNVGINTSNPVARLHVADSSVVFSAIGDVPLTPGNVPISGAGRRMMWYPDKAAFRAGMALSDEWDEINIGNYSFAIGNQTKASGFYSSALGKDNTASGEGAVVMGSNSIASGFHSFVVGNSNEATALHTIAIGYNNEATQPYTIAMGKNNIAEGENSFAIGEQTIASGGWSISAGYDSRAIGTLSVAIGGNLISKLGCFTIGGSNDDSDNPTTNSPTNRIFQIGNGEGPNVRSNALTVLQNGNVGIGTLTPIAPLQFANNYGSKIALKGTYNEHFGLGIAASNLLQIYTDAPGSDIAFGWQVNPTFGETMRIKGNGNVGIGTTNPNALLQFPNNILNRKIVLWESANNDNQYYGFGINGGVFRYQVGGTADNHVFYAGVNSTTSNELFRIQGNGNAILAGTLTQLSDINLKKNIQPLQNSLQKIQQLNGYTYNWKDENNKAQQIGLIAQEVQQQFPQLVVENNNKLSVNYSGMIPVLLEAIKEQQKQIDELKQLLLKNK